MAAISYESDYGIQTYFSITCNMLGQLMKLSVSKSPAGQKVPDMVSVKRVSQSALQYSNFPREILNEYRLRLSVWHEILSNIINDMYVSIWTTL